MTDIENKLDLKQIIAFTRLVQSPVFIDKAGPVEDCSGKCGCNAACGCNAKPSCCEWICGCDQKPSGEKSLDDARTISALSDPKYTAIVESFDPGAVKTITDFMHLATYVQSRIKG
jgi:hypothetical protein